MEVYVTIVWGDGEISLAGVFTDKEEAERYTYNGWGGEVHKVRLNEIAEPQLIIDLKEVEK